MSFPFIPAVRTILPKKVYILAVVNQSECSVYNPLGNEILEFIKMLLIGQEAKLL